MEASKRPGKERADGYEQRVAAEVRSQQRYLELLLTAGELLGESLDYRTTLLNVCRATVESIADICLLDLVDGGRLYLAAAAHADDALTPSLQGAGRHLRSDRPDVVHPVVQVVESGKPLIMPRLDEAARRALATSDEHERFMRDLDYCSIMVVPLLSSSYGTIGALTLVRTCDSEPYSETHVRFALDLARRCASAIAKARLYEQSVRIATQFQRAALPPSLPNIPGIAFDGYYEPSSEELLVGGDWYDAFILPDGRVAITVGDVLGHGLDAAVWMSRLRNGLRATLYTDPDPVRALVVADRLMRLESEDAFTTALVALIDPIHQTLACASAGHPGPIIYEPNSGTRDAQIQQTLPLGLRDLWDGPKTATMFTLRPGVFFAFFTDGLLEWNRDIKASWIAVEQAIARQDIRESAQPACAIREAVIDASSHRDDLAILTMRVDELVRYEVRP